MEKCEKLEKSIYYAMNYAIIGEFRLGITSFITDIPMNTCTSVISESPGFRDILIDANPKNIKEFEELLRGFKHVCICPKKQ